MEGPQIAFIVLLIAMTGYLGNRLIVTIRGPSYRERILRNVLKPNALSNHTGEFAHPEVIKVTDGVYMAIGYALANSILIDGPEGLVIVDVTESYESGREVFKAFRNITKKPVKALIYTHNHADHTFGASAFIEDPDNPPEIWAHIGILKELRRVFSTVNPATYKRAMRQFGVFLPDTINAGIGLKLKIGTLGIVYPNKFVTEQKTDVTLAGIPMTIVHIPGETDDQIGVWLPEKSAFLCADDLYRAFPNLYAIRGTPNRELMRWVKSLDRIIEYHPEHLIPSHTRPLSGKDYVNEILTSYRDAIQYVHDQTVRYINQGLEPDEIVTKVKLPKSLEQNPFLKEFYGTVAWSVKSVFSSYLGWFNGNPVDLQPLTLKDKAEKMVKLMGINKLLEAAKEAYKSKDFQWALELSTYVLETNTDNVEAREIKIDSLTALGSRQISANGRNYYLTSAFEEALEFKIEGSGENKGIAIKIIPITELFYALPVRFRPEDCETMKASAYFEFLDTNTYVKLTIRNGVAVVAEGKTKEFDVKVSTTEQVFREMMGSRTRALTAYGSGELNIDGGVMKFRNIMGCFENS